jgi:pyrroline-5-carboxylate reductase
MGVAVLSGVVASLEPTTVSHSFPKWETHTPGTSTPTDSQDATVPSRFIACVRREGSANKLKERLGGLGRPVEVAASKNLEAIQQSDVVLLWCAHILTWTANHPLTSQFQL